jgi:DNA-binding response OmpR family regulator
MARILVIDDHEPLRDMLKQALEESGHTVKTAADGGEGLELFGAWPAQIVITDILMPDKEGIQTIMELRRAQTRVKIIAISGGGTLGPETYLNMARELGADRTLAKPFSLDELEKVISELL